MFWGHVESHGIVLTSLGQESRAMVEASLERAHPKVPAHHRPLHIGAYFLLLLARVHRWLIILKIS